MKRLLPLRLRFLMAVTLILGTAAASEAQGTTYTTNFPLTENPISEAGQWINGQAVGLDWKDVRTTPGLAFGADASGNPNYNDPTALLTGAWGADQTVQATVYSVNQQSGTVNEEVELRLRSAISARSNSGYEINFRCRHDGSQYVEIVRWNGPLGNFTYVQRATGPGLFNGDVVKATIVGNVITAYINGTQVIQGTDSTFATGNPGIGFYLRGGAGLNTDFGFTSFTASDGGTSPSPPGTPTSPNPANGSTGVSTTPTLTWSATGASTYDVQFGTSTPPPLVVSNQSAASYAPAPLNAAATYYWQIVARNSSGSTPGPVWSLTTAAAAGSSYVSDTFTGANGAALASHPPDTGGAWIDDQAGLQLTGNRVNSRQLFGDARSHVTTTPSSANYEVSMDIVWSGATSSTALGVVGRGTGFQFRADGYIAYYDASRNRWELAKLVGYGTTSLGTYAQTYTPGQTHALKLRMVGNAITVQVDGVSRITVTDSSISARNNAGLYARYGAENTSMVGDNYLVADVGAGTPQPPGMPASPNPANGLTGVSTTPTLMWSATGASTYDVRFGTTTAPPLVASATSASYTTVPLTAGATYYWQIVAYNSAGTTTGPVWAFTTATAPAPASITSLAPTSGPVGISVTITGTNFGTTQGTSTVTFSGTTAAPATWSATSIVVPVPAGATTGNVAVTVGGVASNGVAFTLVPTPSVTTLNPTNGPIAASVTITGTNFGATQGTSTVSFNGTMSASTTWSATSVVVPVPAGATTGNVGVTVGGVSSNGVTFTVSGGAQGTIYASDTFTGASGTALASHPPDTGGAWIDDQAGLQLTGNRVNSRQLFGDARSHVTTTPSSANYEVSMDIVWSGASSSTALGVVGRGTGFQFRADGYIAYYDASRNRWELIKLVGYGTTSLGTYAQTYTPGQTHALKLRMVGSAITVYVDGVARISVTDSSISARNNAGLYGRYAAENTSMVGDNYLIADVGAGTP